VCVSNEVEVEVEVEGEGEWVFVYETPACVRAP